MASEMEAEMARFEEEINNTGSSNYLPPPNGPFNGRGPRPGFMQGGPDFMPPPSYNHLGPFDGPGPMMSQPTVYSAPPIITKPPAITKPEPETEKPTPTPAFQPKGPRMDIAAKYSLQGGVTMGSANISHDKHSKHDPQQPMVKNIQNQAKHSQGYKYKAPAQKKQRYVRTAGGETWEDPTLLDWDPNDYRIFCGDLGNEVTDEVLARVFSKYDSFQRSKVVRDKHTKKTKGYGFVSFKDPTDFIRAMREMNGKYVGNRPIKLRKSSWKERNKNVVKKKLKEKRKLGYKV